jgi:hypothetical protein
MGIAMMNCRIHCKGRVKVTAECNVRQRIRQDVDVGRNSGETNNATILPLFETGCFTE